MRRGEALEEVVWGSFQISARLCRVKWRKPVRSAWIIRASSENCTLTLGREHGRGLGSGYPVRALAGKGKQACACSGQGSMARATVSRLTPAVAADARAGEADWGCRR